MRLSMFAFTPGNHGLHHLLLAEMNLPSIFLGANVAAADIVFILIIILPIFC